MDHVRHDLGVSERRACQVLAQPLLEGLDLHQPRNGAVSERALLDMSLYS